nr:MAG TPA: hypothetical protein [Caudoviricetes sp.]
MICFIVCNSSIQETVDLPQNTLKVNHLVCCFFLYCQNTADDVIMLWKGDNLYADEFI